MRLNSLAFRLAASAALVSIVLLVSAGIPAWLSVPAGGGAQFRRPSPGRSRRSARQCGVGRRRLADDAGALADTRFKLPLQGWYWQITPVGGPLDEGLFSDSLLEQRLMPGNEQLNRRDDAGIAISIWPTRPERG
jgi:hypothetical protein